MRRDRIMKIAYVINYIAKNGPSRVVINIIRNMDLGMHSVSLLTLFPGNDEELVGELRAMGIGVYECTALNRKTCLFGKRNEFIDYVVRENFDIVHSHGFFPDILSAKLPCSVRKISTIHNNMFEDYVYNFGYLKSVLIIGLHIAALRKLDVCAGCSRSVHNVMKRWIGNSTYVCNGIAPVKASAAVERSRLGIPDDGFVYVYAGALSKGKNVEFLVKRFAEEHLDNEYLIVLGDGDETAACRQAADAHVRLMGYQMDAASFFRISDVYVSASKSEGFSIAVLEALSHGLKLLLSDIPSHREVIEDSPVYLGEIFSPDGFSSAISKLREAKQRSTRDEIMEYQNNHLSDAAMAREYCRLYFDNRTR